MISLFELWEEHMGNGTCRGEFTDWQKFREFCMKNGITTKDTERVKVLEPGAFEDGKTPSPQTPAVPEKANDEKPTETNDDKPKRAKTGKK